MPTGRRYDFLLDNKGYILARPPGGGRAWQRSGTSDAPSSRSATDAKYGAVADELDHPEVWEDWSGGFGYPYRRPGENTYHWAENFDARVPHQLVHAQACTILSFGGALSGAHEIFDTILDYGPQQFGGGMVGVVTGSLIGMVYVNQTTMSVAYLYMGPDVPNTLAHLQYGSVVYGSYQYFPDSSGTCFYGVTGNLGALSVASFPAYGFTVIGNRMWRYHGPDTEHATRVQQIAGPDYNTVFSGANWSATYNIGNYRTPIQVISGLGDQIIIGTRDGVFVGDQTATFVNVLSELGHQTHNDNCRDMTIYQGGAVVPHIAGLFRYQPNGYSAVIEDISPPSGDKSPVRGRIRAVRAYGRYLYGGLYTGSQSWLLSGEPGTRGIKWHTLQRLPHTTKISRIHVDGITTATTGAKIPNRMWIATDASIDTSGTAPVYYWPIPTLDGNPLSPSPSFSANYIGSARIDLGSVDWGSPSTPKVYRSFEVWADSLASGAQWCNIYYTIDSSSSRWLLGTVAQSPKDTIYFPTKPGTTNVITNPSFETNATGWTLTGGATISRVTTDAYIGIACLKVDTTGVSSGVYYRHNANCTGQTWSLKVRVKGTAGKTYHVQLSPYNAGPIPPNADTGTLTADGTWQESILTLPDIGNSTALDLIVISSEAGAHTLYVDAAQLEQGNGTDYCDGTRPYSYWTGTAHASSSSRIAGYVTGQSAVISVESFTASAGISPVYRAFVLRGALRPKSIDQIVAVARIADNMRDRQGSPMRSAAMMIAELRALGTSASPVTLIDLTGATNYVTVLGTPGESEIYQSGSDEPEVAAMIKMAVQAFG